MRAMLCIVGVLLAVACAFLLARRWGASDQPAERSATRIDASAAVAEIRTVEEPAATAAAQPGAASRSAVPASVSAVPHASRHAALEVLVRCNGAPLAGAALSLEPSMQAHSAPRIGGGRTDALGRSRLEGLEPGEFFLRVDRGHRQRVRLVAGETCELEIELRGGTVRGTVTNGAGEAIAGARARVAGFDLAVTDARGQFELTCLARGASVSVWAEGYACSDSYMVPLLGTRGVDIAFVLDSAPCAVVGAVVGPLGEPLAEVSVSARVETLEQSASKGGRPHWASYSIATATAADGSFRLDGLRAGSARIVARSPGLPPVMEERMLVAGDEDQLVLVLHAGGVVEGIVRSSSLETVGGAYVGTYPPWEDTAVVVRSAPDGTYRLTGVSVGVEVTLDADDAVAGRAQQAMQLTEGVVARWDPVLAAGNVVSGFVADEAGAALPGLFVGFFKGGQEAAWEASDITDADGRFRLIQLPPGPGRVVVRGEGHSLLPAIVAEDIDVPCEHALALVAARARIPSAWIVGAVVDSSGGALEHAEVLAGLVGSGSMQGFQVTVGTAEFRVGPLPPGEWRLEIQAVDRGRRALGAFRLAADSELDLGPVLLDDPGQIRLEIRVPAGRTTARSRLVGIVDEAGALHDTTITGGPEVLFGPLQPGKHRVQSGDTLLDAEVSPGLTTTIVVD